MVTKRGQKQNLKIKKKTRKFFSNFWQKSGFLRFCRFSIEDLIINFWDNFIIQGAKNIFVIGRIQIQKKLARAFLRALRALENWKNRVFWVFLAHIPEISARANLFTKNQFFESNRWLLHQKRKIYFKNSLLKLKKRPLGQNHTDFDHWSPLSTKWPRQADSPDILCRHLECSPESGLSFCNFRMVLRQF